MCSGEREEEEEEEEVGERERERERERELMNLCLTQPHHFYCGHTHTRVH